MIFTVKNGSFSYDKHVNVLKNINVEFDQGQVVTVLGPNGVGKTTLLKCMMGLLKWNKGDSYIDGVSISKYNKRELFRKIAYVPQAKDSSCGYTAKDMVLFGRSAHIDTFRNPKQEDVDIAEHAMEEIGITHLRDKCCNQMSGGELQMVLIARSLATKPNMLVLDEPESNLDFKNQLIVLDTITMLSEKHNISSLINTHYPQHALKISDMSLILSRKHPQIYGKSHEVITEDNLKRAFDIEVSIEDVSVLEQIHRCIIPLAAIQN